MRTILLFFMLFILSACQNSLTNELYKFGEEFELAIGEEVRLGKEKISVEFVDVLEDSRCPSNANCIWAGNGKVQIQIEQQQVMLNTYLEPQDTTISNLGIELLQLAPYPEHPRQFEKDEYKMRLLITRR